MIYSFDITPHLHSTKADELFAKARELKLEDRTRVRSFRVKRFFRCIILGAIGAVIGFFIVRSIDFIDAIQMEGPTPLAIVFAVFGCILGLALAGRNQKKPRQAYPPFYYNKILGWIVGLMGARNFKIGHATSDQHESYNGTGLGDTTGGALTRITLGYSYKIGNTPIFAYDIERRNRNQIMFTGYVYEVPLDNPLDFTVRINTSRHWQKLKSAAAAIRNDQRRYEFESAEMAQQFTCIVEASNKKMRNTVTEELQARRDRNLLNLPMRSQQVTSIDEAIIRKSMTRFASSDDLDAALQLTSEIITPQMEEFLMHIRKKYGPYTMLISDKLYIQLQSQIYTGKTPFFTSSPFGVLFRPRNNSNKDISSKSLQKASDVLNLGILLDDAFNNTH
ncbi:MAG: sulfite exporter TauE/SafE family protein [Defluviitaleaceae bacterium]|nr:sulfite exporter TauE/SafE family protein [Defluviitaleaceae bacterium]